MSDYPRKCMKCLITSNGVFVGGLCSSCLDKQAVGAANVIDPHREIKAAMVQLNQQTEELRVKNGTSPALDVMSEHAELMRQIDIIRASHKITEEGLVPANKGIKHDAGKPPLSLNPKEALEEMARAFDYGAKKYGRGNYKKGIEYTRLIDAALRHINAFSSGEDLDPESSQNHISHALSSLAMLMFMIQNKSEFDDR